MKTLGGCICKGASEQGLDPDYTIADAAKGLRAGQAAACPDTPCHGDIFHIQHQFKGLVNFLSRRAQAATSRRQQLEQKMSQAKLQGRGNTLSTKLHLARQSEQQAMILLYFSCVLSAYCTGKNPLLAPTGNAGTTCITN